MSKKNKEVSPVGFNSLLAAAIFLALAYIFLNPYYLFPDGQGYFSYLPSLVFDGDIDFYNEFTNMRIPVPPAVTSQGYISNIWSFGSAFFWLPFYYAGRIFMPQGTGPYSGWFWFWTNMGTLFYSFCAFTLIVSALKRLRYKDNAVLIALLAFAGTPMLFYSAAVSSTSHSITAFASSLYIYAWLASLENYADFRRYLLLGLSGGLLAMVRPQEALFALVLPAEILFRVFERRISAGKSLLLLSVALAAFIAGISPQLFLWRFIDGSFFSAPAKFNLSLEYFALGKVLFSSYHGMLLWTPLFFASFAGLLLGAGKKAVIFVPLLVVFVSQILINASCVAFWEGYSFGLRQMTSLLPVAALGIAELLASGEGRPKVKAALWCAAAFCAAWTLGLFFAYYNGLDLLGFVSAKDIVAGQSRIFSNISAFVSKTVSRDRIDGGAFFLLSVFSLLAFWLFSGFKKLIERRRYIAASVLIVSLVAVVNYVIIKAHINRPPAHTLDGGAISSDKLGDFFIEQVNELKKKYSL